MDRFRYGPRPNIPDLYPKEGDKPNIPGGIGPEARQGAKEELLRYYGPDKRSFGVPITGDTFKGIGPFLESLTVDPELSAEHLRDQFERRTMGHASEEFLAEVGALGSIVEKWKFSPSWATCNYRYVWSASRSKYNFFGQEFVIGAVGSSCGHEFLSLSEGQAEELLAESINEALLVGGLRLPTNNRQRGKIANSILVKASSLLKTRHEQRPFAWSPNCFDFTQLGKQGAVEIAAKLHQEINFGEGQYHYCSMHKYNPQNSAAFEKVGLPLPGSFGRLRCPSHCAETQALARNQYAMLIPLITGNKSSYLFEIRRGILAGKDGEAHKAESLIYFTRDRETKRLVPRILCIDNRLFAEQFKNIHEATMFPAVFLELEARGLDIRNYPWVSVGLQNSQMIIGVLPDIVEPRRSDQRVNDFNLMVLEKEAEIPLQRLRYCKLPGSARQLWASTLPCIHCLNTISRQPSLDEIIIDKVDWESMKGDDGLVVEALLQFPGKLVVPQANLAR